MSYHFLVPLEDGLFRLRKSADRPHIYISIFHVLSPPGYAQLQRNFKEADRELIYEDIREYNRVYHKQRLGLLNDRMDVFHKYLAALHDKVNLLANPDIGHSDDEEEKELS